MRFSILIANYNNSRFLANAINSVIRQDFSNWEIIVVDDGSTDEFEEVIKQFKQDERIRVFRNRKNSGCGYTKRRCARFASGEILAFLDPDDALHPDALSVMHKAHEQFPGCSLVHSTHYICDEHLSVKRIADYPKALPAGVPYLLLSDGRIHHFASFKNKYYVQTEGISSCNKKAVDQDLYYKLEEVGDIYFIDVPLYYYRIHPGSISNYGKEAEATRWHYAVIEEACVRRINAIKKNPPAVNKWLKTYRTRCNKIRIFKSFRQGNFLLFFYYLAIYPFNGGMKNLIAYFGKMPREGFRLVRKSFFDTYQIK